MPPKVSKKRKSEGAAAEEALRAAWDISPAAQRRGNGTRPPSIHGPWQLKIAAWIFFLGLLVLRFCEDC